MAAEIARPHAPPMQRKKLRFEIDTARCDLVQCACNATRVGWNVKPIPMPDIQTQTAMTAGGVLWSNSNIKPAPLEKLAFCHKRSGLKFIVQEYSQRPEAEAQPNDLTVPLQTRNILSGTYRRDRLACHHRRCQSSRDNGGPATRVLIVQGQVV